MYWVVESVNEYFAGIKGSLYFLVLRLFAWPPALARSPDPQFAFTGPGPQFVFTNPDPQFVFTSPGP